MGNLIDLTNQKFGELTVIERDFSKKSETYWFCQCSCGKIISATSKNLRRGRTKSCGCQKGAAIQKALLKDLTGQRFGKFVVLELDKEKTKKGKGTYWICHCDCGKIKSVYGHSLIDGKSQSCGCYAAELNRKRLLKDLTGQRFGKLVVLEYDEEESKKHNKTCWLCQCDCGNKKSILANSLTRKNTTSCGCLKNSIGENNIIDILEKNNIDFKKEYTISELGNLRYDFYLPKFNRFIEFDGIQHFDNNQKSKWNQNGKFEIRKENDEIKNEYALKNGYDLIRIPYWERDNITLELILGDKYKIYE